MKVLVIYDSVFGNTEKIAQAIGGAMGETLGTENVEVHRVGDVNPRQLGGLTILVAGSPTRGFRATPATYKLLGAIPAQCLKGVKVAAFDTRISVDQADTPGILRTAAKLFGYAADPIAKRLTKKGGALALPPEGFFVLGTEGPLREGELERAAAWARQIAAA
jgi:flavodoxin I